MLPNTLSILLIVALIFSVFTMLKKRKQAGVTGIKSALTSITFFLIAITNLLAYWLDFIGLISWVITVSLLIIGAYCTRYLVLPEGN